MSVHSTSYTNHEDYLADLAWEYRKGGPNDPEDNGRRGCYDCCCYAECQKQVRSDGYPQCEEGYELFEDDYEVYEALQDTEFLICKYETDDAEALLNSLDPEDIRLSWKEWKENK